MATSTSHTAPSSPNPSTQGSPRSRSWNSLRTGEPGSAFRGVGRGKSNRHSGVKGGRGGGHPTSSSGQKASSNSDAAKSSPSPSPSPKVLSSSRKPPMPTSTTVKLNGASEKIVRSSAEHGSRSKPTSRRQPLVPAVVVAPASPSETSPTVPSPSRPAVRRRRPQSAKSAATATKPSPMATKTQKSRGGSATASQSVVRKDLPPHLAAAHEAEIRHDIDALVERVRAVAMAENRPTTPGSHIDWAGDEDDSLPDLDDWGVTTTHADATRNSGQSEEISPILADALKPLPEPNSEVHEEEEREMESYDTRPEQVEELTIQPSSPPSPTEAIATVEATTVEASEQCIIVPVVSEERSSTPHSGGKLPLRPSLPPKPVVAMESLRARGRSISKLLKSPSKAHATQEVFTTKTEGLSESMHAPSADERAMLERVSGASSSELGLTTSIHAPPSGLPESHSAPSLLSGHPTHHTHSRSHTEGGSVARQSHTAPPSTLTHRHGRSGASSPLGKHVYTHSRNHSTPAGGTGARPPQASRPVITGEAISRLARTIGGLGPAPRTQAIPVTKDSTISS